MSFSIKFPSDAPDKMIYEILKDVYYQFNKSANAWIRLDGYTAIGLATPADDGLMDRVDFKKLKGLIVPPPVIKLKPDGCSVELDSGIIDLKSLDNFLQIETSLDLVGPDGVKTAVEWNVVKDVYGIDFSLDIEELLKEVEKRGNLTVRQKTGDAGKKGETGYDGIDQLDTGPIGEIGASGKNAPFTGAVTEDPVPTERSGDKNLAIVDVTALEGDKEGKLVLTRANVGNPTACPSEVVPIDKKSPWVVVLDGSPTDITFLREKSPDCKYSCRVCVKLKFLYIDAILQSIDQRFQELVYELKRQKEEIVKAWLNRMITLFNQQKAAICCALENYTTRARNARARERVEGIAVGAAGNNLRVVLGGLDDAKQVNYDALDKNCLVPGTATMHDPAECRECAVEFIINGKKNLTPETAVVGTLPAGCYTIQITNCCVNKTLNTGRYTGRAAIQYGKTTEYFPDFGDFNNNADAASAYVGLTLTFNHPGGPVKMWVDDAFGNDNSGEVIICAKQSRCFEQPTELILTSGHTVEDIIDVYMDGTAPENQLGAGLPYLGSLDAATNYSLGKEKGGGAPCVPADPNCDESGPNLTYGPIMNRNEMFVFFYDGSDGLSMFIVMNKKNVDQQKSISLQISIDGNDQPVNILALNDAGELTKLSNKFTGEWVYSDTLITVHGRGGALGFLQQVNPAWEIKIKFLDLGYMQRLRYASSDGSVVTLAQTDVYEGDMDALPPGTAGIGDSLKNNTFIFRKSGPGCFMPASQVDWYIRGLRINACCSAVVEFMGAPWAIIKRSIGPDGSCGGGESATTECIAKFLNERGHPSLAWPVLMPSREGIGVPTSGYVEFVEDAVLESQFLAMLQAGQVTFYHGDLAEHQVILFPRIF